MTILFKHKIKRFQERSAETADPSASLGMTKEEVFFVTFDGAVRGLRILVE
jgi:hypothetical protein